MNHEIEVNVANALTDLDWQVRLFVYRKFVEQGRPPTVSEAAAAFGLSEVEGHSVYQRLDDAHQIVLEPGTTDVRMANPLSAVETPFRVTVQERMLFANCAWDSLGIPAMLGADARIDAVFSGANGPGIPAQYAVVDGELTREDGIVHFPIPVHRWYEDLIHT